MFKCWLSWWTYILGVFAEEGRVSQVPDHSVPRFFLIQRKFGIRRIMEDVRGNKGGQITIRVH